MNRFPSCSVPVFSSSCRQMQAQVEKYKGLQDDPLRARNVASSMGSDDVEELLPAGVGFHVGEDAQQIRFLPDLYLRMTLYRCVCMCRLSCVIGVSLWWE